MERIKELYEYGLVNKLPKIVGVQAKGATLPVKTWTLGLQDPVFVEKPYTIASAIRIGKPINWPKALMSDYEGKLTPYAQPKEIIIRAYSLGIPIGEKVFVTLRIPNISLEEFDRTDLAIEAGIVANYYSFKLLGVQAVKWFMPPMVEDINIVRLVQRLILKKRS